jgi:lipoate-protein ligase A
MSTIRPGSGQVFAELEIYYDINSQSGALNMAIDEALLEIATVPTIRFYRWDHPALSFGYFGKFADVENENGREIVRRWTGGGIVFHGEDLTYSIVIPEIDSSFSESATSIYEKTHRAIQRAVGSRAELAAIAAPKISESCFANAVRADVLLNGQKIAGAAQRRTRRGLLQQGSIQGVDLALDFGRKFAAELSGNCHEKILNDGALERAEKIAGDKYATAAWLRRR